MMRKGFSYLFLILVSVDSEKAAKGFEF
jgi:hypothetical protein